MDGIFLYLIFFIPPMLLGMWAQKNVKSTFERYSQVPTGSGMSGHDVARQILDRNGLGNVPIEPVPGSMTDHYDPQTRTVRLSETVYGPRTVSAVSVAAHEVGHAIQHAEKYAAMQFRSALWPVTAFASKSWQLVLFAGFGISIFSASGTGGLLLIQAAILMFAVVVFFQLVTLPVEFDASKRAGVQLAELGLVSPDEQAGSAAVLKSAAWTYVAGALASIAMLAYYVMIFMRR